MAFTEAVSWKSFEKWSSAAFLFAGVAWAGDAALNLYELFGGTIVSKTLFGLFIILALLGTMVGVVGFHRSIADRSNRLALAGTLPIAVAGIIALVTFVWLVVAALFIQSTPPGATGIAVIVLVAIGLLMFGVASFHTGAPSRIVGVLLLAIVAVFLVFLGGVAGLYGLFEGSSAVFTLVLSLISVAVAYHLRTGEGSPDRNASSPESMA